MLKGAGLNVSIVMQNSDIDKNTVIETDPPRNSEAEIGSTVLMYVSLGPEIYDVVMPNVVGSKKAEAVSTLEGMGFTVQLQEEDSTEEADTVIAQSIPALTEDGESNVVSPDQTVVITYSSGKLPTAEVSITFAVPDSLKGKATFNAYVNGNIAGTISVDNIAYVSTISVPVEGTDTQKVVLEAADSKGDTNIIGEYTIDFTAQTVTELKFDKDLLSGSELMVTPVTTKCILELKRAKTKVWLPEGTWFDFFNGMIYEGGRSMDLYRTLEEIPVLAKAGAIIPMTEKISALDVESNPDELTVRVYAGADNTFVLYEDDNTTMAYEKDDCAKTSMTLDWGARKFTIAPVEGNQSFVPESRMYCVEFGGSTAKEAK